MRDELLCEGWVWAMSLVNMMQQSYIMSMMGPHFNKWVRR